MSTQVQFRRGTTAQTASFTGVTAEITVDTTKNTVVVHDGSTAGGFALARESALTANSFSVTAAFNTANAAFASANISNGIDATQNNTITAAFLAANAATATDTTQNNSITAAFTRANNSINANTGGTISANLVIAGANLVVANGATEVFNVRSWSTSGLPSTSNSTGTVTITGGVGVKGSIYADAVYDGGIEIIAYANSIFLAANTPSHVANSAATYANGAFAAANAATATDTTQNNSITAAFNTANASFTVANNALTSSNGTIIWATANSAASYGNSAFVAANSAGGYANSAFATANAATATDTTQNNSITAAFASANAAFTRANNSLNANTGGTVAGDVSITGNLTVTGLTTYTNTTTVLIADNIITVNAAISQSAQPTVNAGIEVDRGAQPNSSFLWIESSGKWAANNGNGSIFIAADSAESYANSAFAAANAATAIDTTQNNSITAAFNTANASFLVANGTASVANTDFTTLSATAGVYGNAAFHPVVTLTANGRVSSITNTAIAISADAVTSGTLAVARGGTGVTTSTGTGAVVLGTAPTITLPVINNIKQGYSTTATAAGTTTLTVNSNYLQFFTGTTTQTLQLPAPQTMTLGMAYFVVNNSTGNLSVIASNSAAVATILPGTAMLFVSIDLTAGGGATSWSAEIVGFSTITGTGAAVLNTSPTLSTPTVNRIDWPTSGTGAPTFTTRSDGTKLLVYPAISGVQVDYAIGIDAATLWSSVPVNSSDFYFKWYGGTTNVTSIDGTGTFTTRTINVYSTTTSTSNTTGALTVLGGVGVTGNVSVDGIIFSDNTRQISAGASIGDAMAMAIALG